MLLGLEGETPWKSSRNFEIVKRSYELGTLAQRALLHKGRSYTEGALTQRADNCYGCWKAKD